MTNKPSGYLTKFKGWEAKEDPSTEDGFVYRKRSSGAGERWLPPGQAMVVEAGPGPYVRVFLGGHFGRHPGGNLWSGVQQALTFLRHDEEMQALKVSEIVRAIADAIEEEEEKRASKSRENPL